MNVLALLVVAALGTDISDTKTLGPCLETRCEITQSLNGSCLGISNVYTTCEDCCGNTARMYFTVENHCGVSATVEATRSTVGSSGTSVYNVGTLAAGATDTYSVALAPGCGETQKITLACVTSSWVTMNLEFQRSCSNEECEPPLYDDPFGDDEDF